MVYKQYIRQMHYSQLHIIQCCYRHSNRQDIMRRIDQAGQLQYVRINQDLWGISLRNDGLNRLDSMGQYNLLHMNVNQDERRSQEDIILYICFDRRIMQGNLDMKMHKTSQLDQLKCLKDIPLHILRYLRPEYKNMLLQDLLDNLKHIFWLCFPYKNQPNN